MRDDAIACKKCGHFELWADDDYFCEKIDFVHDVCGKPGMYEMSGRAAHKLRPPRALDLRPWCRRLSGLERRRPHTRCRVRPTEVPAMTERTPPRRHSPGDVLGRCVK